MGDCAALLHDALGRGYGRLGLDVRRGAGCDLRLRRPRLPGPALRARERRARAAAPQADAPDAARRRGYRAVPAAGYLFQTLGLLYTTPTNSGLITGLFVVFAPLTARIFFKVHISPLVLAAVFLSLTGMVLLA